MTQIKSKIKNRFLHAHRSTRLVEMENKIQDEKRRAEKKKRFLHSKNQRISPVEMTNRGIIILLVLVISSVVERSSAAQIKKEFASELLLFIAPRSGRRGAMGRGSGEGHKGPVLTQPDGLVTPNALLPRDRST